MSIDFSELTNENYLETLKNENIKKPTPIQERAIPIIRSGADIVASSPTGTGKTLAYLLPVLDKVDISVKSPQVLIITPTRELAAQVFKLTKLFKDKRSALLIGGADLKRQLERLKEKPHIIIGTVGRLLELIKLKKLSVHQVKATVIDEADRMLDRHNVEGLKSLLKALQRNSQLIFFSATLDTNSIDKIKTLAKEPHIITLQENTAMENIEHIYFQCEKRDKIKILRKIVHALAIKKALIFLNEQDQIEITAKRLNYHGLNAKALFGQANRSERRQALNGFLSGRTDLLVTSDIAARGLDIAGLEYVIHLDMPETPNFYLHRAGRTGRMGNKGISIIIAEPKELTHIKNSEKKLDIKICPKDIRYGRLID